MVLRGLRPLGLNKLKKELKTNKNKRGTYLEDMLAFLKKLKFKVRRVKKRTKNKVYLCMIQNSSGTGSHFIVTSKYGVHNDLYRGKLCKTIKTPYIIQGNEKYEL